MHVSFQVARTVFAPAAVVSDFAPAVASSAPTAARDGPAKHTKSPAANINAQRPLALIVIWQSPHLPVPEGKRRTHGVSATGQKKGIFGRVRAKTGQRSVAGEWFAPIRAASNPAGASQADRC
jgi:hypothetical protein